MSKKINLNKSDSLKDIVGQIVDAESAEVTLTIPNFSRLAEPPANFKVLKKLADAIDKKIIIESVDDRIVQLAKEVNIEASNPFFSQSRPRRWEDIETGLLKENESDKKESDGDDEIEEEGRGGLGWQFKRKHFIWLALFVLLIAPSSWLALNVLPRAEIEIVTQKSEWQFNDLVAVEKNGLVATQIISQKKNAQMTFPATGRKVVNKKATGKIIVYNAYSSEPQKLVATTRFMTADGKVFRLVKDLAVPGATIVDGQISRSSVETGVIADKAGEDYNIGPVAQLSVPGFQGTPKEKAFSGEIKEPLKGGFSGSMAYPTEADIKSAQAKIAQILEDAINNHLNAQLPPGFKAVEGSRKFVLLKSETDPDVNEKGEFSLIAEGEVVVAGFKEKDLLAFLKDQMQNKLDKNYLFKTYDLKYGIAKIDFQNEKISLPVDFKAIVEKPIDVNNLRKKIAGKSETDLKGIIFSIPGLSNATVTLWPFYVASVPNTLDPEKLKIKVK